LLVEIVGQEDGAAPHAASITYMWHSSGVLVKRSQGWGGEATFEREPRKERVYEADAVHDAAVAEILSGNMRLTVLPFVIEQGLPPEAPSRPAKGRRFVVNPVVWAPAHAGQSPSCTRMARSTARMSSSDKVANLDLSRCLLTVAIWSAIALRGSPFKSTRASHG
jgi:hypothetical protein